MNDTPRTDALINQANLVGASRESMHERIVDHARKLERVLAHSPRQPVSDDAKDARPCTCHPDDNPPRPCPQKYALNECRAAALSAGDKHETMSDTQKEFHEWFLNNYSSGCIISSPEWHAPKIYRAATRDLMRQHAALRAQLEAMTREAKNECVQDKDSATIKKLEDRYSSSLVEAVNRMQAAEARAEAVTRELDMTRDHLAAAHAELGRMHSNGCACILRHGKLTVECEHHRVLRERAEALQKDAERLYELEKANVGLASESAQLRGLLSELVEAVDGMENPDEMDGDEFRLNSARLAAALDEARPHTEAALIIAICNEEGETR